MTRPPAAKVLDELAMALDEEANDAKGALELFEESLRIEITLHGPEHTRVMSSKGNIGTSPGR